MERIRKTRETQLVMQKIKRAALEFLRAHQPMPACDDESLDEGVIEEALDGWYAAVEYLEKHPCKEALPLVLTSFGDIDGFEIYEYADYFVDQFPIDYVVSCLTDAFRSLNKGNKARVASISYGQTRRINPDDVTSDLRELIASFVDVVVKLLVDSYSNDDEDADLRCFILMTLSELDDKGLVNWERNGATLEECRAFESDDDVLEHYETIIARHRNEDYSKSLTQNSSQNNGKQGVDSSSKRRKSDERKNCSLVSNPGMTKEKGLAFLKAHQPMPNTLALENEDVKELIQQWEEVRKYFEDNPCLEAIPLFFNSFGDNDGCGFYSLFDNNLCDFDPEQIIPYLVDAMNSPSEPIRELAAYFSFFIDSDDLAYIEALIGRLEDKNIYVRCSVAMTLASLAQDGFFDWRKYEKRLRELAAREEDKGVLQDYDEIFNS